MTNQAHEKEITGAGERAIGKADKEKGYTPFFTETTPRRYSRDRVVDVAHIRLTLSFDLPHKKLMGTAELTVIPIDSDVRTLSLDACDMEIGEVTAGGQPVVSHYDGAQLRIDLAEPPAVGTELVLRIPYSVTEPKAGIYFVQPTEAYPQKPVEVWTQGQDEDSRYWFPCFDYPNERATSEIIVTVLKPYVTLSNGQLIEKKESKSETTFHWRHDTPHVSYLVSLVVGEFIEVVDEWDGIPVTYFHHPGDEERARNSFADTPKMVQFFSEKIGVRYPYAKYSQIPVTDFIFGGMENTTATTQTAYTLHDDRAHLDFSSNPLVSHELAHQWFGNLITCRDWSHGWLNEGFTTYMECCWEQHEHGDEHFQHYMLREMESYLEEDKSSYRRPIVCNRYDQPIELFDRHLYEKGACVQHLIRFVLGERLFWKAIHHYTIRNRDRCVVTEDWLRAIEEATGRNLDELFDQWVRGGGHPEIKISFRYDAARAQAVLGVTQTQQTDELTAVFKFPVQVAFTKVEEEKVRREERTLLVEKGEHQFYLPLGFEPDFVTFDVGNWILKTLDLSGLPEEMLIRQLHHDVDVVGRIHAARELGKKGTRRATSALGEALSRPAPWFVHAEVAKALGSLESEQALEILRANLAIEHPKARIAVVRALGEFRHSGPAAEALLQIMKAGDPSYFVEAAAGLALGKTRDPRAREALERTIDSKESFNEVIRIDAIEGLVQLEDIGGLPKIEEMTKPGVPIRLRYNALTKLGTLARLAEEPERRRVRRYLEETLEETDFFLSLGTIAGLVALGDADSASALRRKSQLAVDGRIRSRARKGAEALSSKSGAAKGLKEIRDELEELKKTNQRLVERLDRLEASPSGLEAVGQRGRFSLSPGETS